MRGKAQVGAMCMIGNVTGAWAMRSVTLLGKGWRGSGYDAEPVVTSRPRAATT